LDWIASNHIACTFFELVNFLSNNLSQTQDPWALFGYEGKVKGKNVKEKNIRGLKVNRK
jgi:hypothetical protein